MRTRCITYLDNTMLPAYNFYNYNNNKKNNNNT